jgi:hypothetical protein
VGVEVVAERAGFEPAVLSHTAFRERHHQPLGHLSAEEDTKGGRMARRPHPRQRRIKSLLVRPTRDDLLLAIPLSSQTTDKDSVAATHEPEPNFGLAARFVGRVSPL